MLVVVLFSGEGCIYIYVGLYKLQVNSKSQLQAHFKLLYCIFNGQQTTFWIIPIKYQWFAILNLWSGYVNMSIGIMCKNIAYAQILYHTEMVMIVWHMVNMKYDTCRKKTQMSGKQKCCTFLFSTLYSLVFTRHFQAKSIYILYTFAIETSKCDRTDFDSAATYCIYRSSKRRKWYQKKKTKQNDDVKKRRFWVNLTRFPSILCHSNTIKLIVRHIVNRS